MQRTFLGIAFCLSLTISYSQDKQDTSKVHLERLILGTWYSFNGEEEITFTSGGSGIFKSKNANREMELSDINWQVKPKITWWVKKPSLSHVRVPNLKYEHVFLTETQLEICSNKYREAFPYQRNKGQNESNGLAVKAELSNVEQALNIIESRRYAQEIDNLFQRGKLTELKCQHKAHCGGVLTGYYYKGKLVYIALGSGGELGSGQDKMYVRDSILICDQVTLDKYEAPANWDEYYKKHPSKDGNIDLRFLRHKFEVYKYYLHAGKVIVCYKNGNFVGKESKPETAVHRDILECYNILLEDLRTATK
jgi:hypothetical protein